MKRKFYCENIDKDFAAIVETKNEAEMREFQQYCQYYNALGSVGYTAPNSEPSALLETKQYLYLFYLTLYPMNVPYSWSLFLAAACISLVQKNQKRGASIFHSFIEEECMNLFLMVFLVPSGYSMRMIIHFSLGIWALLHTCEMLHKVLENKPNAVGVSALAPVINYVHLSKFELLQIKNIVEVFIAVICPFGVFAA
jgi:hypothetical protein